VHEIALLDHDDEGEPHSDDEHREPDQQD